MKDPYTTLLKDHPGVESELMHYVDVHYWGAPTDKIVRVVFRVPGIVSSPYKIWVMIGALKGQHRFYDTEGQAKGMKMLRKL